MCFRIGIDLGGTKTESLLLNPAGQPMLRSRKPTPRDRGYRAILDLVCAMRRPARCRRTKPARSVSAFPAPLTRQPGWCTTPTQPA